MFQLLQSSHFSWVPKYALQFSPEVSAGNIYCFLIHSIQLRDVQVTPDPDQQEAQSPVPDPQTLMVSTELNEVNSSEGLQHQNPASSQNHIKCKT